LDSTNGTYIGGQRVKETKLHYGDKIILGRKTILRFEQQDIVEQQYQENVYASTTRDPLTGAYNRKYMDTRLDEGLSYAKRHHSPYSFLLLDLDFFKHINDTYGHITGDMALMVVASAITNLIRNEDILVRYGGEEFAVLAPGTDAIGGSTLGERIRERIASTKIPIADKSTETFGLTVSIGVVTVSSHANMARAQIISAADENLYAAKSQGRNMVVNKEIL